EHPGFPIAEVAADGSSVITKHEGHGGAVTVGTVTAQLLYEIAGPRYPNPDVVARFDTIELADVARDRVRISGVRGEPPPPTTKVCINLPGGYKATLSFLLTGLDVEAKADLLQRSLWATVAADQFDSVETSLLRTDQADPASNEAAMAELRICIKHSDEARLGRALSSAVTELA